MGRLLKRRALPLSCWSDLLALLYPPLCAGCLAPQATTELVCRSCLAQIALYPLDRSPEKIEILSKNTTLLPPYGVYEKGNLLARLIHAFKYNGKRQIGCFLSENYAKRLITSHLATDYEVVLPVPMHWWRYTIRGFNQSVIIAKELGKALEIPVFDSVLSCSRYRKRQMGSGQEQRWANAQNKFRIKQIQPILERNVLLVDDVLTTGATITVLAQLLMANGAKKVGVAALAA